MSLVEIYCVHPSRFTGGRSWPFARDSWN